LGRLGLGSDGLGEGPRIDCGDTVCGTMDGLTGLESGRDGATEGIWLGVVICGDSGLLGGDGD
jgi:hypothetical protein